MKYLFVICVVFLAYVIVKDIRSRSSRTSQKRHGIKNLTKDEGKKIVNDNFNMLRERWDRLQEEKESGVLKSTGWWYFDEATDRQLDRIKRIGLSLSTQKITKGQASDIIGLFEPAEQKNIEILERHNLPTEGLSETQARELIAKLRTSEATSHDR
jgi:hypothetical protein